MNLPHCNPELIRKQKEEQIALNKTIRKDLDEVLQKFRNGCHEQRCWSHEREVAIDKIIEAMMWLGKDLARIRQAEILKTRLFIRLQTGSRCSHEENPRPRK